MLMGQPGQLHRQRQQHGAAHADGEEGLLKQQREVEAIEALWRRCRPKCVLGTDGAAHSNLIAGLTYKECDVYVCYASRLVKVVDYAAINR